MNRIQEMDVELRMSVFRLDESMGMFTVVPKESVSHIAPGVPKTIPKHHRNHSRSQFSFNWFSLQLMSDTHVQACTSDWKHCQYVRCTMMHLYSICM